MLPKLGRLALPRQKTVNSASARKSSRTVMKSSLVCPALHCCPQTGAGLFTLPLVFTFDPTTGKRNVGMYRFQLSTVIRGHALELHKVGAEHHRKSEERENGIHVAVAWR